MKKKIFGSYGSMSCNISWLFMQYSNSFNPNGISRLKLFLGTKLFPSKRIIYF